RVTAGVRLRQHERTISSDEEEEKDMGPDISLHTIAKTTGIRLRLSATVGELTEPGAAGRAGAESASPPGRLHERLAQVGVAGLPAADGRHRGARRGLAEGGAAPAGVQDRFDSHLGRGHLPCPFIRTSTLPRRRGFASLCMLPLSQFDGFLTI